MFLIAEKHYPTEACGILLGDKSLKQIDLIYEMENMVEGPDSNSHFKLNPVEILHIEELAEQQGQEILGFYHTHPDKPAIPSQEDKKHMIPNLIYVISSIKGQKLTDIKAYKLDDIDGNIVEIPFLTEEGLKK